MRRRILLRIGVVFVLSVAIFLFCLVNVKVVNYESAEYRRIVIRSTQDLQLLIINKKDIDELSQAVYEQDHLSFESEIDTGGDNGDFNDEDDSLPLERFESRQLSVNRDDTEQEQEFYYDNSIPYNREQKPKRAQFTETLLTPVLSRDVAKLRQHVVHLCVVVCEDRAMEALTMLKSAAMVTKNASIVFHIIADEPRQKIMQQQLEMWPTEFILHVSYYIYNVTYFEGTAWDTWKNLYKPCAVQRLFLPDRLLNVDSLIYVDTDVVFLRSAVDLWNYFEHFNSTQLISLVKESEDGTAGWYNRFASHPYYGEFGVNSGVMLMNLTRLRTTNWLSDMQFIYQKYRLMITWGDQDLINIYFSVHPEQLFIMPCEWNYRTDHCIYVSNCKTAEKEGVFLLHGSRGSFYNGKEPAFNAIHQAFQHYKLGDSIKLHLLPSLQQQLSEAASSNCVKVQSLFLRHLSALAQSESTPHEAKVISEGNLREVNVSSLTDTVVDNKNVAHPKIGSPYMDKIQFKENKDVFGKLLTKAGGLGFIRNFGRRTNVLSAVESKSHDILRSSLNNLKHNAAEHDNKNNDASLDIQTGPR